MGARSPTAWRAVAVALILAAGAMLAGSVPVRAQAPAPLRVAGNRLLAGHAAIQLRGVNFSGAQYECASPHGKVWDVPADGATIAAMRSWQVNAVRLPLNEDCWLGINGLPRGFGAERYRREVISWVAQLHAAGIYAVLDLHVSAPGQLTSIKQQAMADADHAPAFWRSVADAFKGDRAVIFDLYNEPQRITWSCWRDGCPQPYPLAGMQRLLGAVRAAGAPNPVIAAGVNWGNDLSRWLRWAPRDPRRQLIAGFHDYNDRLGCEDERCWNRLVAPVAARFPVIAGEIGEFDCGHGSVDRIMQWADARHVSYLAWAWNTTSCGEPSLLSALDGTPSAYGAGVRDHLLRRAQAVSPA